MSGRLEDFNDVGLLFPSEYLQAADLRGRDVVVTIEKIEPRHSLKRTDGTKDAKPVVTLKGKTKRWVLNKTNAKAIAKLHGKPLDWIGKSVTLYATTCEAFGDVVDCVRVKAAKATQQQSQPTAESDPGYGPEPWTDDSEPGSDG